MGRKAIMKTIGIFTGKQKDYNIHVLTLLYDNGPLTAWEITSKMTRVGKQSLHATLTKRLRDLERKEYLQKYGKMWHLRFKGILAVLLIQSKPKIWHEKWKQIFEKKAEIIEKYSEPFLKKFGKDKEELHSAFRHMGFCLDDFNEWINLSNKTKQLMEKGVINFDVIKEETLLGIIIMESMTIEELTNVWNSDPKTNQL
jgi:hypothetical protein